MTEAPTPSLTQRAAYLLLLLGLIILFLYLGRPLLVPLVSGLLFAFLLLPLCQRLEHRGWRRMWASLVSIVLAILLAIGVLSFLGTQVAVFVEQGPQLQAGLSAKWQQLQAWIAQQFGLSVERQVALIRSQVEGLTAGTMGTAVAILSSTGSALATFALVPLYAFFLSIYRGKLNRALHMMLPRRHHAQANRITTRISQVTARYLLGLLVDITILTILLSIGFLLLGIPSAILLAFLAALLNIIPYIGSFIGGLLPAVMALVTKDSIWFAVGSIGVSLAVQFIDNNLIMPLVVGRSVNLNPLSTILALLLGGMIWGLAGMILFVPMAGMFKIVCDNVPALRAVGYLMGQDDTPEAHGEHKPEGPDDAVRAAQPAATTEEAQ